MRWFIGVTILLALIACYYLMMSPTPMSTQTSVPTQQVEMTDTDEPTERRVARERVPKKGTIENPTPVETPTAAAAPDASTPANNPKIEPKGPFTIDLGTHKIHLIDDSRKRVAQFKLQLVTQTDKTRVEIRRRKRELIRMTYFLGSRRQADGAMGAAGKSRFEHDLMERFQNIVRSGSIDRLTLVDYQVISTATDAGVEK